MRRFILACFLTLAPFAAIAQPAASYTPPDAELWGILAKAIDDIPMSMGAHQQIQQLMANVQQEARNRVVRAEAEAKAKAAKEAPK